MSDEPQAPALKVRRPGWPKGKPRLTGASVKAAADRAEPAAMMSKMKARPNWESEDFVGVGMDEVDRLRIPSQLIEAMRRDGVALQWITKSVRGMETPQEVSKMTRGGWTPVHQSDFDHAFDGLFMPKGRDDVITVDDCMLVARPYDLHMKSKMSERRQANSRVRIIEEQMGKGIPNVTGADHATAIRGNHINKTFERIEIPD